MELGWLAQGSLFYLMLLFAITVHECAHAAMAYRCGDDTAKLLGRISLNPIVHMDLIGTVILPLLMIFGRIPYLFGWGKPVPVNPRRFRNYQRDDMLVAVVGPISNICLALFAAIMIRVNIAIGGDIAIIVAGQFGTFMVLNVVLALFNMFPIPPLDGFHILLHQIPLSVAQTLERFQFVAFFLLIIFVRTPLFSLLLNALLFPFALIAGLT